MYKIRFNYRLAYLKRLKIFYCLSILSLFFSSSMNAQTPVTVLYGATAGTGNWFYGPIFRNTTNAGVLNYSRHAYIYTAAELNIPSGAKIVKLEWLKKDGGTIVAPNTFNVWLTNTTATTLPTTSAWSALVTGATQTYTNTSFPVTIGNNTYLEAPFNIAGADSFTYTGGSLQILTDWAKAGVQTGAGINFYVQPAAGKAIGISSQTPPVGSTVLQTATYGGQRPTMRLTYVPVPACSGIPNTGIAISSTSSACTGVPFTLTIQNTVAGTGVSYLWQRSSDSVFTSPDSVGNSASLSISESSSSYYRCIATCAGSGLSYTCPFVYVPMAPHYNCYCASNALTPADEDIFNVTFGSLNNSSNCSTTAAGPGSAPQLYSNYQYITPPNVEKLSTVPLSIQIGTCLNLYPNRTVVFIDYNHNSVFESSELVYSTPNAIGGPHIETTSVTIPATALTGLTGMRVITAEPPINLATIACTPYSFGETEDYLVNITPTTTCTTPNPGLTISDFASVCAGKTVNLSIQNLTTGLGVTYQWYNSAGPIPGATSFSHTTSPINAPETFYCAVTCSYPGGGTSNSSALTITMNSFIDCYCPSMAGNDADMDIFHFTFNGVTFGNDCNTAAPGPGSILGRYSNFHSLGSIQTIDLGANVPFDVEEDDCDQAPYYSGGTSIYIDFNQNGVFTDPGEKVFNEPIALEGPRHVIGHIVIPCDAKTGQTGLRVIASEGLAGGNTNSCLMYGYGETEDYIITLKYPDTCSVASNPPGNTVTTVSGFCDSASSFLSLTNKCMFNNFNYQWYQGDYPGTLIPGATSKTYQTPMLYNTTTFYCSVSCGSSTVISTPKTIHKVVVTASSTQTASAYCLGASPITLFAHHTASGEPTGITFTYSPNTGLSSIVGDSILAASPLVTTTYTITATTTIGCSSTTTATVQSTRLPVTLTASSTDYCVPSGVPVTLTAAGGLNYSYSPTAGLTPDTGSVVIATPNVTTTYVMTGSDSTGCSGQDSVTIHVTPCYITLNLKFLIQGYYDAAGLMKPVLLNQGIGNDATLVDSVDLELHDANSPFGLVATQHVALSTSGLASANFTGTPSGSYYVAVKHRNGLQTWSANPIPVNGSLYDFTTSNTKAFGDNMKEVENGLWAFYSGDLNADDNIDLLDMSLMEVDINLFNFGYLGTDVNGDGNVDLLDVPVMEENINNFIFTSRP